MQSLFRSYLLALSLAFVSTASLAYHLSHPYVQVGLGTFGHDAPAGTSFSSAVFDSFGFAANIRTGITIKPQIAVELGYLPIADDSWDGSGSTCGAPTEPCGPDYYRSTAYDILIKVHTAPFLLKHLHASVGLGLAYIKEKAFNQLTISSEPSIDSNTGIISPEIAVAIENRWGEHFTTSLSIQYILAHNNISSVVYGPALNLGWRF